MQDDVPRYLEAYPELDVALVGRGRGGREGSRRVTWYTEFGETAGTGELQWLEGAEFLMSCDVHARSYAEATQKTRRIHYDFLPRGVRGYRTSALCPVCAKKTPKLYLKDGGWACANCQGLRYRSTFIPPQQRWAEEIANLHDQTKEGRPFGVRETTYRKMLDRIGELNAKRVGERKLPGPRFMHCIYAQWDKRKQGAADERQ